MQVVKYGNAGHFLDVAEEFLYRNETANELVIGIARHEQTDTNATGTTEFYSVNDGGTPVLAAMYTPEVWPTMTHGPEQAAVEFARYLFNLYPEVPAVHGPTDVAARFVSEWRELSGRAARVAMRQRLYRCSRVMVVKRPAGSARRAQAGDIALILKWNHKFHAEVGIAVPAVDEERVRQRVEQQKYILWQTDVPVCMAGFGRETRNGATVGPVYTPPECRRRGYATACVAATTQAVLDSGKRYASLYTDLDYPTSNSIYQKIGYRPVIDSSLWRFESESTCS